MSLQMTLVLVVAALATVLVYLVIGRILPGHWGKSEIEASEDFTLDSTNVLIGLLFSIVLAFVIGSVLVDYDHARSDAQDEENAIGAIYGFAWGIPEPAQSNWKRDARNCIRRCSGLHVVYTHWWGRPGRALPASHQAAPHRPLADRRRDSEHGDRWRPVLRCRAQPPFQRRIPGRAQRIRNPAESTQRPMRNTAPVRNHLVHELIASRPRGWVPRLLGSSRN